MQAHFGRIKQEQHAGFVCQLKTGWRMELVLQ